MIDNYAKVQIAQQISRQRSITPTMVSVRQKHTSIVKVESGSSLQPMAETYEGSYDIEPSFNTQTLETSGKIMEDDVTVHPIGVSVTTNLSGGNTVYIGPF